jgi:hypothetical protein
MRHFYSSQAAEYLWYARAYRYNADPITVRLCVHLTRWYAKQARKALT